MPAPFADADIRAVRQNAERLYSGAEVEEAVACLASPISARLCDKNPLCLCIMNGGLVFTGLLLPKLDFPLQLDYLHVGRYRGTTRGGENLAWAKYPESSLEGRCVLILDDILDQGITLHHVMDYCKSNGAAEIYTAVLADKIGARVEGGLPAADFSALTLPNRYVFGYGLDYKTYWRNAPGIYAIVS